MKAGVNREVSHHILRRLVIKRFPGLFSPREGTASAATLDVTEEAEVECQRLGEAVGIVIGHKADLICADQLQIQGACSEESLTKKDLQCYPDGLRTKSTVSPGTGSSDSLSDRNRRGH